MLPGSEIRIERGPVGGSGIEDRERVVGTGGPSGELASEVRAAALVFSSNLDVIGRIVIAIGRRHALQDPEIEELRSEVYLHLLENDYTVLRKWRGEAMLSTYLTAVANNCFRGFLIRKWGRWRPSQKAKRLGQEAVRMETLLHRDGYSFEEAYEILRTRHCSKASPRQPNDPTAQSPPRDSRQFENGDRLDYLQVVGDTESRLENRDKAALKTRVLNVLQQALRTLSMGDRTLLRLRYEEGFALKEIANVLAIRQRSIYTRHERCLRELRSCFEQEGLRWPQVAEILGWDDETTTSPR